MRVYEDPRISLSDNKTNKTTTQMEHCSPTPLCVGLALGLDAESGPGVIHLLKLEGTYASCLQAALSLRPPQES